MSTEPDDLMLLYVAGVCDADETERAEALLSAANPVAAALLAEAVSVFHAVPFGLTPIEPPLHCRQSLFGRVTADVSSTMTSPMSIGLASRLRWPLYVSSGLAACLAVALTMSLSNGREMARQMAAMSERDRGMQTTLATAREVMASPKVTLANLTTKEPTAMESAATPAASKPFCRALFCPISRRYTFGVYNLRPLPDDRKYEMWLLNDGRPPIPAAVFNVGEDGSALVVAQLGQATDTFRRVAITEEPANGSLQPTGRLHLAAELPPVQ